MTRLLAVLLTLFPFAAHAASPEQDYLAAREAYIKTFKLADGAQIDDKVTAREKRARADLEKKMRAVVGPLDIKGFAGPGTLNLETLINPGEMGFGQLDGLVLASRDRKSRVIVTAETLLAAWIREHENWWERQPRMPQALESALKWPSFYTQAMSSDAAVFKFAELPVAKPARAKVAAALLVGRSQDMKPETPAELIVSVVQGGRAFVVSVPPAAKVRAMPACDKPWEAAQKQAEEKRQARDTTDARDKTVLDEYALAEEANAAAFARCFTERARSEAFFQALTRQAQTIVDQLP